MKVKLSILLFIISLCSLASVKSDEYCQKTWSEQGLSGNYDFSNFSNTSDSGNLGYQDYSAPLKRQECLKEWTVLIYMAADNDLSAYAYWDLHEMETQIKSAKNLGASTDQVDVVVELDTLRRDGIRRLHMFQSDLNYQDELDRDDFDSLSPAFIKSPIVEVIDEFQQVSAAKRFSDFLEWGIEKYPAKNYMVVIWGHGEGYLRDSNIASGQHQPLARAGQKTRSQLFSHEDLKIPAFSTLPNATIFPLAKPFGGIAFDHSDLSFLSIPQIETSLKSVSSKYLDKKKIDILAFDACLMQSLEVLSELKDTSDFIIGSNQIQNYLGLPYRSILDSINEGAGPQALAKELPRLTQRSWAPGGYQAAADDSGFKTFTMSTVSSWQLREVILPELQSFSKGLLDYLAEDELRITELRFLIENAPRFQGEMIDLGLFYGLVEQLLWQESLRGVETSISKKLKREIIHATEGIGHGVLNATFGPLYFDASFQGPNSYLLGYFKGISIWLPKTRRLFSLRKEEMSKSQLHQGASAWNHVQSLLYAEEVFDLGGL